MLLWCHSAALCSHQNCFVFGSGFRTQPTSHQRKEVGFPMEVKSQGRAEIGYSSVQKSWITHCKASSEDHNIVGVLGGGHWVACYVGATSRMAIRIAVLDPHENCSASAFSYDHMVGRFDDRDLFGYPLMVKSKRLAYDGRGNAVAHNKEELSSAVGTLGGYNQGLYIEKWAPFVKELAVIVARGRDNSISCYPVVETIHQENICHIVKAPADVPWIIRSRATDIAKEAINSLEGVGVFAVELFLTRDGQILLNEVAPRPHNSGHHTIESCFTSQFEQHLRAIVGLPLGDPSMKGQIFTCSTCWDYNGFRFDLPIMRDAANILNSLAHRTPEMMYSYALSARERGIRDYHCRCRWCRSLARYGGCIDSITRYWCPCALFFTGWGGLPLINCSDAKRCTVATVAINNARNAGLLAARILAVGDADMQARIIQYQQDMKDDVLRKVDKLEKDGWEGYSNP
ncbi:hypothetical protein NE237_028310 [Protea cynaroides]|uniref:phosphoribosylaminoimidazole carboxylase n=1 Tax=Protea cynaroides TaxID=273540 RepID=A0A9Q0GPN3_9MAGN|nr:hypothetical protein NE237_028310 [Protea cynaroides]